VKRPSSVRTVGVVLAIVAVSPVSSLAADVDGSGPGGPAVENEVDRAVGAGVDSECREDGPGSVLPPPWISSRQSD